MEWFKNYLDPKITMRYSNGVRSNLRTLKHCVLQGSNLGSLLFLIYIIDLPNASTKLSFFHFADDTNHLASHKSLGELIKIVNQELSLISDWLRANGLFLNILKAHFILFRSYGKRT